MGRWEMPTQCAVGSEKKSSILRINHVMPVNAHVINANDADFYQPVSPSTNLQSE